MEINVINPRNQVVQTISLTSSLWKQAPHQQAIYDVIVSQQASLRQGTKAVKNRAQVRGGGRKPRPQKGSGRARQGSIRAPQWRGGGVVFGPTAKANYQRKVNKKVYRLAMRSILADKQARGLIKVIDAFPETRFSTKEYVSLLTNLKLQDQKVLIVSTNPSLKLTKSCANLSRVEVVQPAALNPLGLMKHPTMLISLSAFKVLETIY